MLADFLELKVRGLLHLRHPFQHAHSKEWELILEKHSSGAGIWLQTTDTSQIALIKQNVKTLSVKIKWPYKA